MCFQADLELSIPSSTAQPRVANVPNSTRAHARALRVALESLDDIQRARREQVTRATRLADAEDITPRILKAASGFEQWVEVQPAMLEDILDEELAKYDKFATAIQEGESKQEALLATIKVRYDHLLVKIGNANAVRPAGTERAIFAVTKRGSIGEGP